MGDGRKKFRIWREILSDWPTHVIVWTAVVFSVLSTIAGFMAAMGYR